MKLTKCMVLLTALMCGQSKILKAAESKVLFLNKTLYAFNVFVYAGSKKICECEAPRCSLFDASGNPTELSITLGQLKGHANQDDNLYCKAVPQEKVSALTKGLIGVCTAHCDLSKEMLDTYDLQKQSIVLVANSAFSNQLSIERREF